MATLVFTPRNSIAESIAESIYRRASGFGSLVTDSLSPGSSVSVARYFDRVTPVHQSTRPRGGSIGQGREPTDKGASVNQVSAGRLYLAERS